MFSKAIEHPFFNELKRHLSGYEGKLISSEMRPVGISIRGRSESALDFSTAEIKYVLENIETYKSSASEEAYAAYEGFRDAIENGDYDPGDDGIEFPQLESKEGVWRHMTLEYIDIAPKDRHQIQDKYQIRLGFDCMWDVEHDFGIYVTNRKYEYSGVSV